MSKPVEPSEKGQRAIGHGKGLVSGQDERGADLRALDEASRTSRASTAAGHRAGPGRRSEASFIHQALGTFGQEERRPKFRGGTERIFLKPV